MINQIKDSTTVGSIDIENRTTASKQPAATNSITNDKQVTDSVNISSASQQLDKLKKSLANLPEVDQKKVSDIKESLASNTYKIDSRKIAESMF